MTRRWTEDIDRVAAGAVQQRRLPGAQGETQILSSPGMQVMKLKKYDHSFAYWSDIFTAKLQNLL